MPKYNSLEELEKLIYGLIYELDEEVSKPNRKDDYIKGIKYASTCLKEILKTKGEEK